MFREQLKRDLDGISPDEELLSKISSMMAEEVQKPKQPIYMNVVKWGSMAAAICLIAVGTVAFLGRSKDSVDVATADATGYSLENVSADDSTVPQKEKEEYDANHLEEAVLQDENNEDSTLKYFNFDIDTTAITLNYNPDLSKKTIPADYNNDYLEPLEISDLVDKDTDIVIVKILDSSEYAGSSFSGEADIYSAQAEAVVDSEMFLAGDIIPVFVPRSSIEANLKTGKSYLLITEEFEGGIFKIHSGRESVFEIDGNTVTSQSHLKIPSMLDGLTVEEAASILKYEQNLKK